MKRSGRLQPAVLLAALSLSTTSLAQVPSNLFVENVPAFPPALVEKVRPYLDSRSATFVDWNPMRAEMLVRTRFAETNQLHVVKMPGGARRQLTFLSEQVGNGSYKPRDPDTVLFSRDTGGNEQFQFYRLHVPTGEITLLTDGKSRNTSAVWSRDGKWIAFSSNRRNGRDLDIWIMDPMQPSSARMALQVSGGGWFAQDFSRDNTKMIVGNYVSVNESELYLVDVASGTKTLLTPKGDRPVSYSSPQFSADDSEVFFLSDREGEFKQLFRMKLSDRAMTQITRERWDVDEFRLSEDRTRIVYVTNENGASGMKVFNAADGKYVTQPNLPIGVIGNVDWHPAGRLIGFSMAHAKSPSDAYSFDIESGKVERWTESETGGLNAERNSEPQLITVNSFDRLPIAAFIYRPDPARFPGKRPSLISIHGGPEGQSRPTFLGRNNYIVNELGIALIYPNVRGSEGYGKTFVAADNGMKREDSVKDIGALLDWLAKDPALDAARVGVTGGSYGGYMVLASLIHHGERLRAGVNTVGISSFLTFLQNTSGYRVDLRRVEYGDERDPKMKEHLQKISPMTNAAKIKDPLFVIMGFNDPRVPYTEGEQIAKAVRSNGAPVWYLMAKDEGHGFVKRANQEYAFIATIMFLQEHLLK